MKKIENYIYNKKNKILAHIHIYLREMADLVSKGIENDLNVSTSVVKLLINTGKISFGLCNTAFNLAGMVSNLSLASLPCLSDPNKNKCAVEGVVHMVKALGSSAQTISDCKDFSENAVTLGYALTANAQVLVTEGIIPLADSIGVTTSNLVTNIIQTGAPTTLNCRYVRGADNSDEDNSDEDVLVLKDDGDVSTSEAEAEAEAADDFVMVN